VFQQILVPLDGSARAERALPVAARVARATGAQLLLFRAVALPVTFGFEYEEGGLHWHLAQDEAALAKEYLTRIAQRADLAALPVETLVAVGAPADLIIETSMQRGVDLVILTSHGRTGPRRWLLGSVASHVAHHSEAAVLVLPERGAPELVEEAEAAGEPVARESEASEPQEQPLNSPGPLRVLVPLDGSARAEVALAPALALSRAVAGHERVDLHLMLVVTPYDVNVANKPAALLADSARGYLERTAEGIRAARRDESGAGPLNVTVSVVEEGDVASAILGVAAGKSGDQTAPRYDLLAMATHGHTGITRWALGGVAERLLRAATLPLLVVRAQAR
jgi:nucleotide-binding universal stress UspA family protein